MPAPFVLLSGNRISVHEKTQIQDFVDLIIGDTVKGSRIPDDPGQVPFMMPPGIAFYMACKPCMGQAPDIRTIFR